MTLIAIRPSGPLDHRPHGKRRCCYGRFLAVVSPRPHAMPEIDPKKCIADWTAACVHLRFLIGVSDRLMGRETLAAANHPKTCPATSGHCGAEPGSLHTRAKIGDMTRRCVPKTHARRYLVLFICSRYLSARTGIPQRSHPGPVFLPCRYRLCEATALEVRA